MATGAAGAITAPPPSRSRTRPGASSPAPSRPVLQTRSRFEDKVVRTLEQSRRASRAPSMRARRMHLLNGTITPNALHFTIMHTGIPDIDPDQHKLVIHGLVQAAAGVHARHADALSDGVAHAFRRMRRQQRADVLQGAAAGDRAGSCTASSSCAEWTGRAALDPARRGRRRSEGQVDRRRRRRRRRARPQRAAARRAWTTP